MKITKQQKKLAEEFIDFLSAAPTSFHAVSLLQEKFEKEGFRELKEQEVWELKPGQSCFVKNEGAIIAFKTGDLNPAESGFRLTGAHTDSPALKVKPHADFHFKGYLSVNVEVYGSPILTTWFDRDLSLAGRVTWLDKKGEVRSDLIDVRKKIAVIPSLAIHLNRDRECAVNPQKDLPPIVFQQEEKGAKGLWDFIKEELPVSAAERKSAELLNADLFFYDAQKADFTGWNDEFICGARLDNLISSYIGARALMDAEVSSTSILVLNDHEEVGSSSYSGAAGNFLGRVMERIAGSRENYLRSLSSSMLVSADNTHAVHPNYKDKHDPNHHPILNKGPAVKTNANQRYATDSISAGKFLQICREAKVPVQFFANRSDLPCGSTIGPITTTELGIPGIDIGVPTFAMHSIRETAGTRDLELLLKALRLFWEN